MKRTGVSTPLQWRRRISQALLSLVLCLHVISVSAEVPEYRLKAAYLYNFASFTQWPVEHGDFQLCVFGSNPFGSYLEQIAKKQLRQRTIQTRIIKTVKEIEGCDLVFVTPLAGDRISQVLKRVEGLPVLTVADSAGAFEAGVMINLQTESDKVQFDVNLAVARQSHLRVSSKLLRLARRVEQ